MTLSFVMPSKYELGSLPAPKSGDVELRRVPGFLAAALSFSGHVRGEAAVEEKQRELLGLLQVGRPGGLRGAWVAAGWAWAMPGQGTAPQRQAAAAAAGRHWARRCAHACPALQETPLASLRHLGPVPRCRAEACGT